MTIEPFRADDIDVFLELAAAEGWLVEAWELAFLLTQFQEGCFCLRNAEGNGIAFVTSLLHEKSGWIGNLLVSEAVRGQGVGEALFRKAQEALYSAGAVTFWLTASKMGRLLYERHGFRSIDSIVRWVGSGRQSNHTWDRRAGSIQSSPFAIDLDRSCWGDRREILLAAALGRGWSLVEDSGFLVVQQWGAALQLGPFSAQDSGTAEVLLEEARHRTPLGTKIFLDAPVSNRPALRMFNRQGLRIAGRTELMYAGVKPDYRPELLYGLATMGSCG